MRPRPAFHDDPGYRAKLSAALKGRPKTAEHRARLSAALKGRMFSDETRARMSAAKMGQGKGRKLSDETKAKMAAAKRGRRRPAMTGALNHKWKGGVAPARFAGWRQSIRLAVISRDRVCQDCGEWDERPRCMHAHHVDFDETNHALSNLLLLCVKCHRARHSGS